MASPADRDRTRTTRATLVQTESAAHALVLDVRIAQSRTAFALPASGNVTLGRSRDVDVPIDHESVSRRHALLHVGSQLLIQDLGSRNGTCVRRAPLEPRMVTEIEVGTPLLVGSVTVIVRRATDAELRGADVTTMGGGVEASERRRISEVLAECGGNQTKAAKKLGISRRTLVTRLGAYGLPRPRKASIE